MPDAQEFLIVESQGQRFALPALTVAAVVAPQAVTPLPFVPPHVEGLININECILPLLNLRRLLTTQATPAPALTELLVVETGHVAYALRVDRILVQAAMPADAIQQTGLMDPEDAPEQQPLPAGLIEARFSWQEDTVLVLRLDALGRQLAGREPPQGARGLLGRLQPAVTTYRDTLDCLVVLSAGEKYAIPLTEAVEVLDLAPATPLPGAPEVVEGIARVRQEVLLVLSLPRLLRLGNHAVGARTVVVMERHGTRLGLRVDAVQGMIAFAAEQVRRVDDPTSALAGVVVHAGELFSLLEAGRLLPDEHYAALAPLLSTHRRQAPARPEVTHSVLEIRLGREAFGLPLQLVRRIAELSDAEALPGTASGQVTEVVYLSGHILPVVDLAVQLRVEAVTEDREASHNVGAWVIVGAGEREWAIPVHEARQILELPESAIETLGGSSQGLVTAVANVGDRLLSLLNVTPWLNAA